MASKKLNGDAPATVQRRRFARIEADQSAVVECGERYFTVGLIDLSSNGARIRVSPAVDPDTITHLIIPDIGGRLRCEVIWQEERIAGLRFLEKPYEVVQKMQASMRRLMVPLALD
jgi:c-di-GMP-binding flagellar brake protein YcgR